jgi:hypothetical protein
LSYTLGSVIPCFVIIHTDGIGVEHLFPGDERPTLRLLRRVRHPESMDTEHSPEPGIHAYNIKNISWTYAVVATSDMKLVTHEVGLANWWIPSKDVVQGPNTRLLEGEIHLSPDLQPSCDFQSFRIEVCTCLLGWKLADFLG